MINSPTIMCLSCLYSNDDTTSDYEASTPTSGQERPRGPLQSVAQRITEQCRIGSSIIPSEEEDIDLYRLPFGIRTAD